MKFAMIVPCKCGTKNIAETTGDNSYGTVYCANCHVPTHVIDDHRISRRSFARAEVELTKEDWSLTIILSAMSVETELAYLHSKWKALDADLLPNEITKVDAEAWEEAFRKLWTLVGRLDGVAELLVGEGFDSFLLRRSELTDTLKNSYPNLGTRTPKQFFSEELFHRRNKILHSGQVQFGKLDAELCLSIARSMLQILNEIDKERYTRFDKELHSKSQGSSLSQTGTTT
jgi:hypothetical protein